MADKTSVRTLDWTLIFAAAAWILVLALGGWVDTLLDQQAVEAAALSEQQTIEAELMASRTAGEEQLAAEARSLAVTRTESLAVKASETAQAALDKANKKPAVTTQNVSANTSDSTELPSGAASGGSGIALVATKTGGNFKASVYNGNTGAGNLGSYQSVNSDVKAWLRIPGTNINNPVMQSTRGDHYYEYLTWQGGSSRVGSLWTQMATRFGGASSLSSNTVIYGHNWNNCRWNAAPSTYYGGMNMFESLLSYHYTSWAEQYPYIYYSTPSEQMTFVIFACFYTEAGDWYIYSEPNMSGLISGAQSRSRHSFGVDVNSSDKILTLSTCTRFYGNTDNQRFVVMARLLRPGEEIGPVSVSYNPNHMQPNVWG